MTPIYGIYTNTRGTNVWVVLFYDEKIVQSLTWAQTAMSNLNCRFKVAVEVTLEPAKAGKN